MNKQILIAGLLGAANAVAVAAPTPCENAFVAKASEGVVKAEAEHASAVALTAGLATALSTAQAAQSPVAAVLLARQSAKVALQTAYDTANAAWTSKTSVRATAIADQLAQDGLVTTANAALATSNSAVTAQNLVVANLQDLYDELAKAITDDTAAIAALQVLLDTATTNETTAIAAQLAAIRAFNAAQALRSSKAGYTDNTYNEDQVGAVLVAQAVNAASTAIDGDTQLLAAATTDIAAKLLLLTDAKANATYTTPRDAYSAAQLASDKATAILTSVTAGCNGICATSTLANDPVLVQKGAATTVTTTNNAGGRAPVAETTYQKGLFDTQTAALAGLSDTWQMAVVGKKAIEVRDTALGLTLLQGGALFDTRASTNTAVIDASTGATALKTAAATNLSGSSINTDLAANTTKRDNLKAELDAETLVLAPLVSDVTVKTYLASIPIAAKATADANVALAGTAEITAFLGLKTAAATALATAQAAVDYAQANATVEDGRVNLAQTAVTANANDVIALNAAVGAAGANKASAIAACKGAGYTRAQAALVAMNSQQLADATKATSVASSYAAKAAFSSGGGANTPCAQVADADGVVTRAVCSEGFCCGAAQKIERNGDKLAVETCQANTGVRSYQYYPPLAAGATVEPTPETWRFQCISGATQLAAAATAALVAATML